MYLKVSADACKHILHYTAYRNYISILVHKPKKERG